MTDTKRIRLLYPGTFTATDGRSFTYAPADLAGIAASYDPAADPAPLVVGHPKLPAPAFGWAKSVAVEGEELVAYADKIDPAFAEAVQAGRYGKVSASLYEPEDPNNPKPGSWYLKHIGFLGGAAPAVKGLGMVAFAESDSLITLETDQETQVPQDRTAEYAERETALSTRESDIADRERKLAEREAAARHDANVAFAEVLIEGAKLAPSAKDLVVGIMDELAPAAPVSFGEANGELAPLAAFKKLFDGAGTIVAFGEHARPPADKGKGGTQDPQVIADRAVAFCETEKAAGRSVTVAIAVRKIMAEDAAAD